MTKASMIFKVVSGDKNPWINHLAPIQTSVLLSLSIQKHYTTKDLFSCVNAWRQWVFQIHRNKIPLGFISETLLLLKRMKRYEMSPSWEIYSLLKHSSPPSVEALICWALLIDRMFQLPWITLWNMQRWIVLSVYFLKAFVCLAINPSIQLSVLIRTILWWWALQLTGNLVLSLYINSFC